MYWIYSQIIGPAMRQAKAVRMRPEDVQLLQVFLTDREQRVKIGIIIISLTNIFHIIDLLLPGPQFKATT